MADPTNPAAPAAAAPVVVATPTKTVQEQNAQREATVGRQPVAPGGDPAAAEVASQRAGKEGPRSSIIRNPAPVVDPDAPVPEKKIDEDSLPASTRAEMQAGRDALKRNRPGTAKPAEPAKT